MAIGTPRVWLGIVVCVAVAGLALLTAQKTAPRLPSDRDHGATEGETVCLTCHAHHTHHPRTPGHPLRDDCFSCHRDSTGELHPRRGAPTSLPDGWASDPRLASSSPTPKPEVQ